MYTHIKTYSRTNYGTVYSNKNWKYPKYPLREDWISQFQYVYMQGHQTVFNVNELELKMSTQIHFKNIRLNKETNYKVVNIM